MSIYDYNANEEAEKLTPPNKRKPNNLATLSVLVYYVQYLHDLFFDSYADGNSSLDWVSGASYSYGDRVRYIDNKIYELKTLAGISGLTDPPSVDVFNWILVLNNWVGVRERSKYNSQRMVFEYALNKWFKTTFRQFSGWDISGNPTPLSDIYISVNLIDTKSFIVGVDEDESSAVWLTDEEQLQFINLDFIFQRYMFTINIPLAVYDALLPLEPSGSTIPKDNVVRAFADDFVLGGVTYNINPY